MEIKGRYCKDIKIFTDNIEEVALGTIHNLADRIAYKDRKIRIMPDCHQGKGETVIGFTSSFDTIVAPAAIGCDIGCGIEVILFDKPLEEKKYAQFERKVRKAIPTGMDINSKRVFELKTFLKFMNAEFQRAYQSAGDLIHFIEWKNEDDIFDWCKSCGIEPANFYKSIGTLGGGNHFLEYDENTDEKKYAFVVHTGSRNIGLKVFNKHEHKAKGVSVDKSAMQDAIREYVANFTGDKTELPERLARVREKFVTPTTDGYLMGEDLKNYLTDMVIAQAYAKFNRKVILDTAAEIMAGINKAKVVEQISSIHNYLCFDDLIIRKGAIRSYKGEKMIIPFNMRDGVAICEGKSNDDWNCSAPHGSGRAMSRSKAKSKITLDTFKEQMDGIYSTSVCESTIDEAPDAYKPTEEIIGLIKDTCDVLYFMKPKINIKAKNAD